MRSFFVVYAVLLSCMLLPGTALAVKKKPGRTIQVGVGQKPYLRFPSTTRVDVQGGKTEIRMKPSYTGDSAWFFTPCAANTKGIFPAVSGRPIGVARHQFSCVLPGEVRATQFMVSCAGRLSNSSAMYTALDPSKPFFQISLECSS